MRAKTRTEQAARTIKTIRSAIEEVDKHDFYASELISFNLSCIRDVLGEICLSLAVICDKMEDHYDYDK